VTLTVCNSLEEAGFENKQSQVLTRIFDNHYNQLEESLMNKFKDALKHQDKKFYNMDDKFYNMDDNMNSKFSNLNTKLDILIGSQSQTMNRKSLIILDILVVRYSFIIRSLRFF